MNHVNHLGNRETNYDEYENIIKCDKCGKTCGHTINNNINQMKSIPLSEIDYKKNGKKVYLAGASLAQIIKSMEDIQIKHKKTIYEMVLDEWFSSAIPEFISEYKKLLLYSNKVEYDVKYFNLIGNLPKGLRIYNDTDGKTVLSRAPLGQRIRALHQRISYILRRPTPLGYIHRLDYLQAFKQIQEEMKYFERVVVNFELSFQEAIHKAHRNQNAYNNCNYYDSSYHNSNYSNNSDNRNNNYNNINNNYRSNYY